MTIRPPAPWPWKYTRYRGQTVREYFSAVITQMDGFLTVDTKKGSMTHETALSLGLFFPIVNVFASTCNHYGD